MKFQRVPVVDGIYTIYHRHILQSMAKPKRLALAQEDILLAFSKDPRKVYGKTQLADVLLQNRRSWHLPQSTTLADFISFLTKEGELRTNKLRSKTYGKEIVRFSWGKASALELAMSISPRGYLSHATALTLHGLAISKPKAIYLNVEQSEKPSSDGSLTQDGIDRAFSGHQRQSKLIYTCNRVPTIMLAGKNTNRLGVETITGPESELLQVTNIERTLIDIVVRPTYAGGLLEILNAYRLAKDRVSLDRLLITLEKLDYVYPYHQAIGFLMERSGYPSEIYAKLQQIGLHHNFYLAHAMENPDYSKDWRLFYPRHMK